MDEFLDQTNSGCAMVNDLFMNMPIHDLPFGGVGASGIGAYHGKSGFDTYSHKRSVLVRPSGLEFINELRYSPFSELKWKVIKSVLMKTIPMQDASRVSVLLGRFVGKWGSSVLLVGVAIGYFGGRVGRGGE